MTTSQPKTVKINIVDSARSRWISWLAIVIFFVAWEIVGRSGKYYSVPTFTGTVRALGRSLANGELWAPTLGTLYETIIGLILSLVVGAAIGLTLGISRRLRELFDPVLTVVYSAPIAVLIPVIGIYLGIGASGKIAIVVLFCIFVVIVNIEEGVRDTDPGSIELAKSLCLSRRQLILKIFLPSVMPYFLTSVRVGSGRAIQGAITAELLLDIDNLGRFLNDASSRFQIEKLVAGTLFIALLAFGVLYTAGLLERFLLKWRDVNTKR